MNTQIKFRAYDLIEKRMVYKDLYDRNWYYTPHNDETGCNTAYLCAPYKEQRHSDPMKFTGLHDKNGKEIYEGDILTAEWHLSPEELLEASLIVWLDGAWCIKTCLGDIRSFKCSKDSKIIGNKFENPEILEVKS